MINENDLEFERLITDHRAQLHGFVLSLVSNKSDAEDLLQQVCLTLWQKRGQFEQGTNFLAWARKVARYHLLNHWRKSKNRKTEPLLDEDLIEAVSERTAERELEFNEHRKTHQYCLEKLPERQREAVQSHYFDEISIPKIASNLGIKENAVSQLLFRARTSLINCAQTYAKKIQQPPPTK